MKAVQLAEQKALEDQYTAVLYLTSEVEGTELLLFEEKVIKESRWRDIAAAKSRKFKERARAKYEQIACEMFAGDRFIRRMKKFRKIIVFLNKPIEPSEVRSRLKSILRDSSYHHLRWLIVDLILLPFSLLTVPVPGPNLIGYYLLFRVYSHWKSYRSATSTQLDQMDIQVNSQPNEIHAAMSESKDVRSGLEVLRHKFGLRALQEHKFIPHTSLLRQSWRKFRDGLQHAEE